VNGSVSVYSENGVENQVWVVFKRNSGDPFEFKKIFDAVVSHPQIKETLHEEDNVIQEE
jgi:hypothetical protein